MTDHEKHALVRRLQEGRRRAKRERPKRLAAVEARMDALEQERRATPVADRRPLYHELADLGAERLKLKWGDA